MVTLEENIQIPDTNGEMQRVRAIVDCGATSIFMTPRLLKRLAISHQAADITTLGRNGGVMQHARAPEDADHCLVLGLSRTGIQMSRASRANACIRFSMWLTMVPQTKS